MTHQRSRWSMEVAVDLELQEHNVDGEKGNPSRPRDGRSRMSSGGTFKTIPGSWTHEEPLRTEGVMEEQTPEAEPLKTAGVMNGLTPDEEEIFQSAEKTDALEREIEKSMFEKIQEENHALRLELENIKKAMGVKQSSGVGEQTPPPPPPSDGEERRGNAQERFTPNGTKVPSLPHLKWKYLLGPLSSMSRRSLWINGCSLVLHHPQL